MLKQLPYSFYKTPEGIAVSEHRHYTSGKAGRTEIKKENLVDYVGKGGHNLVKFLLHQDGSLSVARISRHLKPNAQDGESPIIEARHEKVVSFSSFSGVDAGDFIRRFKGLKGHPKDHVIHQLIRDAAVQLQECRHGDIKLHNMLVYKDSGENFRLEVIDWDYEKERKVGGFVSTCQGHGGALGSETEASAIVNLVGEYREASKEDRPGFKNAMDEKVGQLDVLALGVCILDYVAPNLGDQFYAVDSSGRYRIQSGAIEQLDQMIKKSKQGSYRHGLLELARGMVQPLKMIGGAPRLTMQQVIKTLDMLALQHKFDSVQLMEKEVGDAIQSVVDQDDSVLFSKASQRTAALEKKGIPPRLAKHHGANPQLR